MLRSIYNESDLLVAESVYRGLFSGLSPEELGALASVFVYEPRSDLVSTADWPTEALADRWSELESLWKRLSRSEQTMRLPTTRHPDPGFGLTALRWAEGDEFDDLPTKGMAPGDFVRVSRQLTDLLRQLRDIPGEVGESARSALRLVDRGFVAAQGVG
jgi:ATP-dependent RNA helicase HelY